MSDDLISRQELLDSFAGPKIDYRTDLTLKQVRDIINKQKVIKLIGGKKMKKLFISQPMRDKTNEEIEAVRATAVESAERLLGEKVEVIDSYFKDVPHEGNQGLWCLGESIKLLSQADVAYFAENWQDYRGCRIENECASLYDITIIEDYRGDENE